MKTIQTSKGILKYRMPNILEAYDLLEISGIARGESSVLKLKRNIIEAMAHLVDVSELDGITTYEELLTHVDEMILPIGEIADEIIEKTFTSFKKKI